MTRNIDQIRNPWDYHYSVPPIFTSSNNISLGVRNYTTHHGKKPLPRKPQVSPLQYHTNKPRGPPVPQTPANREIRKVPRLKTKEEQVILYSCTPLDRMLQQCTSPHPNT